MLRLTEKWDKIGQAEAANAVDVDVKRATLLAEELAEEAREGPITQQEMAQAIGLSQGAIDKLLRYQRFLEFCRSLNSSEFQITEGRFRAYWQQMSDPQETRKRDKDRKLAKVGDVFLAARKLSAKDLAQQFFPMS